MLKQKLVKSVTESKGLLRVQKPTISFTFDDAPESAFVNACGVLAGQDYYGTFYISGKLLGQPSPSGKILSKENLRELSNSRHEVGCHTYFHQRASSSNFYEQLRSVLKNKTFLEQFTGKKVVSFAYPFGELTTQSRFIARYFYRSGRSILSGVNRGWVDFNSLKVLKLYGDITRFGQIARQIVLLNSNPGWLVLYTHDVCEYPSSYGCSIELFSKVVTFCKSLGVNVLPIGDVVVSGKHRDG